MNNRSVQLSGVLDTDRDASSGDRNRHRLSRAGNRRINRVLHIMAAATTGANSPKVKPPCVCWNEGRGRRPRTPGPPRPRQRSHRTADVKAFPGASHAGADCVPWRRPPP
ncbi:transposase [Actinoplanes sp. NPDC023801]|uniref:transposase n=1 Tax=Actinoplanes sp. NPDC023801 TaxID=3154595 RepID=UPI003406E444